MIAPAWIRADQVPPIVNERWTGPAPRVGCRCGRWMIGAWQSNSGTTYIAGHCPEAEPYNRIGHQWLVRTKPEHAATGCCDTWEVRG